MHRVEDGTVFLPHQSPPNRKKAQRMFMYWKANKIRSLNSSITFFQVNIIINYLKFNSFSFKRKINHSMIALMSNGL